ncbi:MAG: DUF1254 domain-containing protein [bacterium]|nr:DUF1254 domain-containing protein [bacterium]
MNIRTASTLFLIVVSIIRSAPAQQTTSFNNLAPASSDVVMHPEYAKSLARMAFLWGHPMVNMMNRQSALTQIPEPGRLFGALPAAPMNRVGMLNDYINPGQRSVACPNQDVVYGLGFLDLGKEPVVLQVPDFGDRFWVYAIYDQRTDQVGHLGKPYNSEPGFYLLTGPNYEGGTPEGFVDALRSPTDVANIIPRVFMDDTEEDREAIQPAINNISVYPLSEYTGEVKVVDWSNAPSFGEAASGGETKWVKPQKYFDQLEIVLATVAPQPGEEALYSQFRALLAVAKREPKIKQLLHDTAVEMDEQMIADFLNWKYNGKPAGNNWNRSQNNAQWGVDYHNRVSTSRSNIFDNRPNETQYFYTDFTTEGQKLDGNNNYKIYFAAGELPPVNGFWSLTLYDKEHFFHDNDLERYSLGTKNKTLKYGDDGSLVLYAGSKSPGADKKSNWLPAPDDVFSLYLRAYWGKEGITEGTWKPPIVEKY